MKHARLGLAALVLSLFALVACQNENPIESAATETNVSELSVAPDFAAQLEAEIMARAEAQGLAKHGAAEITGPTVITQPGVYRVANDFSASGDAIVIQASYVLLNLGRHTITGPGNKDGRGIVIDGADHVLVQNGRLRTFGVGVALLGANHSAVRKLAIKGGDEFANPPAGIPPQIAFLLVNSYGNFVANNEAQSVNLGIFVRGGGSGNNTIVRNAVRGEKNGLLAICYNPAAGEGPAGPRHDFVAHNTLARFGVGIQTSAGSAENKFNHNTIYYFNAPWEDFNGSNEFNGNSIAQVTP